MDSLVSILQIISFLPKYKVIKLLINEESKIKLLSCKLPKLYLFLILTQNKLQLASDASEREIQTLKDDVRSLQVRLLKSYLR